MHTMNVCYGTVFSLKCSGCFTIDLHTYMSQWVLPRSRFFFPFLSSQVCTCIVLLKSNYRYWVWNLINWHRWTRFLSCADLWNSLQVSDCLLVYTEKKVSLVAEAQAVRVEIDCCTKSCLKLSTLCHVFLCFPLKLQFDWKCRDANSCSNMVRQAGKMGIVLCLGNFHAWHITVSSVEILFFYVCFQTLPYMWICSTISLITMYLTNMVNL